MAKGKQAEADSGKPNKSQAIRQIMSENPESGPGAVATAVKERFGYEISAAYVSTIKSQDKRKLGKAGGARSAARGRTRVVARSGGVRGAATGTMNVETIEAAIGLVQAAGGVESARSALELLDRLKRTL